VVETMKYLRDGCKGAIDVKRRKKEVGQLEDEEAGKRGEKGAARWPSEQQPGAT
jgi:hypothetical protein